MAGCGLSKTLRPTPMFHHTPSGRAIVRFQREQLLPVKLEHARFVIDGETNTVETYLQDTTLD